VTTPTVLAAPILGHVEGVDLITTGTWVAASGPFLPTTAIIAAAVAALDCPAVRKPVLKAGHDGNHGVGEPALGYVDNLRLGDNGRTLLSDWRGMPAWLTEADPDGQSILASAYPDRSIEGEYAYHCQLGHEHPFVVHAVALLGIERPAIGTLQSLQALYGVVAATSASPGGHLVTLTHQESPVPAQVTAATTTDDVRRAFYLTPAGSDWDVWIQEMFIDPPELIVADDDNAGLSRVPYTVDNAGAVTFGDWQNVKVTYVAARAQAAPAAVTYATHDESRAVTAAATTQQLPPAPAAGMVATAGGTTTALEEPMPDTLSVGLRERLGGTLADDADEATLLAALDEALAERADTTPPVPTTAPAPAATGTVLVDATQLQQLRVDAAAGAQARATQLVEQRTGLVDAAVRDGRVPPARRDAWIAQLTADPGAETVLASLAPIAVPLTAKGLDTDESGQAAATVTAIHETPAYKNWSAGR